MHPKNGVPQRGGRATQALPHVVCRFSLVLRESLPLRHRLLAHVQRSVYGGQPASLVPLRRRRIGRLISDHGKRALRVYHECHRAAPRCACRLGAVGRSRDTARGQSSGALSRSSRARLNSRAVTPSRSEFRDVTYGRSVPQETPSGCSIGSPTSSTTTTGVGDRRRAHVSVSEYPTGHGGHFGGRGP
jgi:hypothetical protein